MSKLESPNNMSITEMNGDKYLVNYFPPDLNISIFEIILVQVSIYEQIIARKNVEKI